MGRNLINKNLTKGFTLIEILAVVIIIGVLSIVGVSAISNYISQSRKDTFVEMAKIYARGAMELKGSDRLLYEPKGAEAVVVPVELLDIEDNNFTTPYGEIIKEKTYILIVNEKGSYKYYVSMIDDSNHAIVLVDADKLTADDITVKSEDLDMLKTLIDLKNGKEILINDFVYTVSRKDQGMSMILLDSNILESFKIEVEEGWSNKPKRVTLTLAKEMEGYQYYLSSSSLKPTSGDSLWQDENDFMKDVGVYYAFVKNDTGEVSEGKKVIVDKIDTTAPIEVDFTYVPYSSEIKVKATATDPESGISYYSYSKDDGATWSEVTTDSTYTFGKLETGDYSIKVRAYNGTYKKDEVSNNYKDSLTKVVSTIVEVPFYKVNPSGWATSKTVKIIYPYGYINEYSIDGGLTWLPYTKEVVFTENGTIIARVTDGTNYIVGSAQTISGIDRDKPKLAISEANGIYKASGNITITATDVGSGLLSSNKYQYCLSSSNTSVTDCTWTNYTSGVAFSIAATNTTKYLWVYPIKDNVENINDDYTSITTPYLIGTYKFDSLKPTITVTPTDASFKTSGSITITVADSGGSELSSTNKYQYCLSSSNTSATGCTWTNYTSGTAFTISGTNQTKYLWVYTVEDNAKNINGNYTTVGTPYMLSTYHFDTINPTVTISSSSGNFKTSGNVTITVADTGSSELSSSNQYQYCLSTSSITATGCTWTNYTSGASFTISATNQTRYLFIYPVADNSGNINDSYTSVTTPYKIGTYNFDSTKPTLTVSATKGATSASVTITVADTGSSGLSSTNKYQYCISNSNTAVAGCTWTNYTSGIAFTADAGGKSVYLWVYPIADNSGNVNGNNANNTTPYLAETYTFDQEKPTLTVSVTSAYFTTSGSIKLTAADTGGSNLSSTNKYQYCLSTSSTSVTGCTWTNYTSGTAFTISATNTTRYLWVYSIKDNAGNVNGSYTNNTTAYKIGTYVFDSTAPTVSYNVAGGSYNVAKTVRITPSDNLSGVKNYNVQVYNNTTGTTVLNQTYTSAYADVTLALGAKYTVYTKVTDNSGNVITQAPVNVNSYYYQEYTIDNQGPSCTFTKTNTGSTGGVTVNWNCTDAVSGIKTVTVGGTARSASGSLGSIKENQTLVATDNAGNSTTLELEVTSGDCSCSTCTQCKDCCAYKLCDSTHNTNQCCANCNKCGTLFYSCKCSTCYS